MIVHIHNKLKRGLTTSATLSIATCLTCDSNSQVCSVRCVSCTVCAWTSPRHVDLLDIGVGCPGSFAEPFATVLFAIFCPFGKC